MLILADELGTAQFFDAALAAGAPPKAAANWVMGDMMAACKEQKIGMEQLAMTPAALAEMIALIDDGVISGKIAKDALPRLLAGEGNGGVRAFVESQGLVQISGARLCGWWRRPGGGDDGGYDPAWWALAVTNCRYRFALAPRLSRLCAACTALCLSSTPPPVHPSPRPNAPS